MSEEQKQEGLVISEGSLVAIDALKKYLPVQGSEVLAVTLVKTSGEEYQWTTSRTYRAVVKTIGDKVFGRKASQIFEVTIAKEDGSWRLEKIRLDSGELFLSSQGGMDPEDGLTLEQEFDRLQEVAIGALLQVNPDFLRRLKFNGIGVNRVSIDEEWRWYGVDFQLRDQSRLPYSAHVVISRDFKATWIMDDGRHNEYVRSRRGGLRGGWKKGRI